MMIVILIKAALSERLTCKEYNGNIYQSTLKTLEWVFILLH